MSKEVAVATAASRTSKQAAAASMRRRTTEKYGPSTTLEAPWVARRFAPVEMCNHTLCRVTNRSVVKCVRIGHEESRIRTRLACARNGGKLPPPMWYRCNPDSPKVPRGARGFVVHLWSGMMYKLPEMVEIDAEASRLNSADAIPPAGRHWTV